MSQVEASAALGVSQTLLSLMETGERTITEAVALKAVTLLGVVPEELPLSLNTRRSDDELAADLGMLGYPGYAFHTARPRNPAEVLLDALDRSDLDARLVEALPWLPLRYPNMNWNWLTSETKLRNRQNRLGFVVSLAAIVAKRRAECDVVRRLSSVLKMLEEARLAKNDTLCQESWPLAQRRFAHKSRTRLAAHWNLDTRLKEDDLAHLAA
jgi:hypothetical protein